MMMIIIIIKCVYKVPKSEESLSIASSIEQVCSGVDPWGRFRGGRGGRSPNTKIPGRDCESIFLPKFKLFCSPRYKTYYDLHIIRHFCSDFWGLKLHQISNFLGLCPGPSWGTYSAFSESRPLAGGEGTCTPFAPPSQEPHPCGPSYSSCDG